MVIKVCGLNQAGNIMDVAALAPEYIGHIFYRGSPRYFNDKLTRYPELSTGIKKTAVFVNEDRHVINSRLNQSEFDALQLHGIESPQFCAYFKDRVTVIKAFGIDERFNFDDLNDYEGKVDFFLFDTSTGKHGGSGVAFNWQLLNNYQLNVPFFLSGGLSLDNLEQVRKINHPQLYGVDLNSRFEVKPGVKDINELRKAFKLIRS